MSRLEQFILTEGINDKGIFKACFMGGQAGSGKSYVISKISGGVEPRIVNSDTWTEFLKVKADQWDFFEDRVKILTKSQLTLYLNSMLPLWVDGTSASPPSVMRRDGILKSFGYDTGMIWVNTSLESSLKRAKAREEKIGRHVDEDFIKSTYERIQKLKPYYKSNFGFFKEVDNDEGQLTDEVIVKLYKSTDTFFKGPIENPIGIDNKSRLIESGGKYLSDLPNYTIQDINSIAQGWFKQ